MSQHRHVIIIDGRMLDVVAVDVEDDSRDEDVVAMEGCGCGLKGWYSMARMMCCHDRTSCLIS
jgi:hypothetical protein